jgi:hypothetical protein
MFRIRQLYLSAGHNFHGHHGRPAGRHPIVATETVECVAGQGLRGDRFFAQQPDYKGQITFFAHEVFCALVADLQLLDASPGALRRNVLTEGVDLNSLIGRRFTLQGVDFIGTEECRPCYWMDQAIGPGADAWLKSRGGLRCRILSDGWLRRDVAENQNGTFSSSERWADDSVATAGVAVGAAPFGASG